LCGLTAYLRGYLFLRFIPVYFVTLHAAVGAALWFGCQCRGIDLFLQLSLGPPALLQSMLSAVVHSTQPTTPVIGLFVVPLPLRPSLHCYLCLRLSSGCSCSRFEWCTHSWDPLLRSNGYWVGIKIGLIICSSLGYLFLRFIPDCQVMQSMSLLIHCPQTLVSHGLLVALRPSLSVGISVGLTRRVQLVLLTSR
jgi:hypothetical protein